MKESKNFENKNLLETQTSSIYNKIARNLVSSIAAGATVAYSTFPLEGFKKYLQSKQTDQFHWYRGSTVFAANIIPTTTIQFLTNGIMNELMPPNPSVWQNMSASIFCGIAGAITATFVENTIVRQQILKSGPLFAISDMLKIGLLRPWKSFPHIATRDGIFTFSMLWAMPESVKYIDAHYEKEYEIPTRITISVIGAALSHPADTIATNLQAAHEKKSTLEIAHRIYKESGTKGFYRGFLYRFGLFGIFSSGLPKVKELVDEYAVNKIFSNKRSKNQ